MKKISFVLLVLVGLFSNSALAVNWQYHTSTIKAVYPQYNGKYVLMFNEESNACTNGSTPNKGYYVEIGVNGMTERGADLIYSSALAAAAAGKTVTILFDADRYSCDINTLRVDFN